MDLDGAEVEAGMSGISRVIMRSSVRNDSKNRKSVILREARTMTNPFSKRGSGRRGSLEGLRDSGVIVGISKC